MSGTGEWRVLFEPRQVSDPLGCIWPYHVVTPGGSLLTLTATLAGAKWKIRREKAKRQRQARRLAEGLWWEQPIVYREAS